PRSPPDPGPTHAQPRARRPHRMEATHRRHLGPQSTAHPLHPRHGMTPSDEAGTRLVIPIGVAAFLSASAAVGAALIAVDAARPDQDELQRAALDELGLPTSLLDVPGAQTIA